MCRGPLHGERQLDAATVAASRASGRQGVRMFVQRTGGVAVLVLAVSGCSPRSAGDPVSGAGGSPPPAAVTSLPSASPIAPQQTWGGSLGSARATPPGQVPALPPVGTVEKLIVPPVQKPSRPGPPAGTQPPPNQNPPPAGAQPPPNQNPPPAGTQPPPNQNPPPAGAQPPPNQNPPPPPPPPEKAPKPPTSDPPRQP